MAKKAKSGIEQIGPTIEGGGFDPTANPVNPQDRLFSGALPILSAPAVTLRRPFTEATRPPLHYSDGPGPDEAVTSRRPMVEAPRGNVGALMDHTEDRPIPGVDKNKYSGGPDDGFTTNGVEIRGT